MMKLVLELLAVVCVLICFYRFFACGVCDFQLLVFCFANKTRQNVIFVYFVGKGMATEEPVSPFYVNAHQNKMLLFLMNIF